MEKNSPKPKQNKKKKKKPQQVFSGHYVCVHCGRVIRAGSGRMREHLILKHNLRSRVDLSTHYISKTAAKKRDLFPNPCENSKYKREIDDDFINTFANSDAFDKYLAEIEDRQKGRRQPKLLEPRPAHIIYVPVGGLNKRW